MLNSICQTALNDFCHCNSWQERTKLLIKYGLTLNEFPKEQKTTHNLIIGCEVNSWLIGVNHPFCKFYACSESKITQGLLALLLIRVNGQTLHHVQNLDINAWFNSCGLSNNLTISKRNGLNIAWQIICAN